MNTTKFWISLDIYVCNLNVNDNNTAVAPKLYVRVKHCSAFSTLYIVLAIVCEIMK